MKNLAKEFKDFTDNPVLFKEVMKYNCAGVDSTYQIWKDKRKFIAETIQSDGTILDIGCAGGFFLKSLQEWSGYNLVPYGIDINGIYIKKAQTLFPEQQDHFVTLDVKNIEQLSACGLPHQYDFVYISIFNLHKNDAINFIQKEILPLAKKRLIIGLYAANKFIFDTPEWKEEKKRIQQGIDNLRKSTIGISDSVFNPTKFNHAVAWVDVT